MLRDHRGRRGGQLPRRITAGICGVAMLMQMGCFRLLPTQETVPEIGHDIAVELNDRGRLMVNERLGESVLRVDGKLLATTDSEVTLSVARTVLLQGSSVVWTGESVGIPREGIRGFRVREYSRRKSIMLAAGVLGGMILMGGFISIVGGGSGRGSDGGGCTANCNGY